jgi:hypothetical protein
MPNRRTLAGLRGRGLTALPPQLALSVLVLLAAAPIVLVAAFASRALVLPSLSIAAIAVAMAAGALAWLRKAKRHTANVTLWDVAGASMLIGCAAAMMSEPENFLQVFGQTQNPNR